MTTRMAVNVQRPVTRSIPSSLWSPHKRRLRPLIGDAERRRSAHEHPSEANLIALLKEERTSRPSVRSTVSPSSRPPSLRPFRGPDVISHWGQEVRATVAWMGALEEVDRHRFCRMRTGA